MADASSLLSLLRGGEKASSAAASTSTLTPVSTSKSKSPAQGTSLLHLLNSSSTPHHQLQRSPSGPVRSPSSPSTTTSTPAQQKPADASSLLMQLMGGQLSPPASALPPLSSPHLAPSTSADSPTPISPTPTTTTKDVLAGVPVIELDDQKAREKQDVKVQSAPVSNFASTTEHHPGRRTCGWEQALGWVSAKTKKLRVIDKTHGAHFTLKGCDNVVDCSSAPSGQPNKHVVAAVSRTRMAAWLVPDSWKDASATYETLMSLDFAGDESLVRVVCAKGSPRIVLMTTRHIYILPVSSVKRVDEAVQKVKGTTDGDWIDLDVSLDGTVIAGLTRKAVLLYRAASGEPLARFDLPSSLGKPLALSLVAPFVAVSFSSRTVFWAKSDKWTPSFVVSSPSTLRVVEPAPGCALLSQPQNRSFFYLELSEKPAESYVDIYSGSSSIDQTPEAHRIAIEKPLVDFAVTYADDSVQMQTRVIQALALTEDGVVEHLLSIPMSVDSDDSISFNMERRPSLAESIHVETEVDVTVDTMDADDVEAVKRLSSASPIATAAPEEPVERAADLQKTIRVAPVTDLSDSNQPTPSASKSSTPRPPTDDEPALSAAPEELATNKTVPAPQEVFAGASSPRLDASQPLASPGSVSSISPLALAALAEPSVKNKRQTSLRQEIGVNGDSDELVSAVRSAVEAEIAKQARQLEQIRVEEGKQSAKRQEELLSVVSSTLTTTTTKLVSSTIQKAIDEHVLPSLSDSLDANVKLAISEALGTGVTQEIERFLLKPQFAGTLVRNLTTALTPSLERILSSVLASNLLPTFRTTLQQAVDQVVDNVKQEMVGVRKEIQREQSGALVGTEKGVQTLQEQIAAMKKQMDKMQNALASMQRHQLASISTASTPAPSSASASSLAPAPAPAPVPAPAMNGQQEPRRRQVSGPRSPATSTSVPVAEPSSPSQGRTERQMYELYESLFTDALAAETQPAWQGLVQLIDSSPSSRLEKMFPPQNALDPSSQRRRAARVSNAVACSIAVRLSQAVAAGTGTLTDRERLWLDWVARAQEAIDRADGETRSALPRVYEWIYSSLKTRETALASLRDLRGAAEIRAVASSTRGIIEELKRA